MKNMERKNVKMFFLVLGLLSYFVVIFSIINIHPKRVIVAKADCEVQLCATVQSGKELILKNDGTEEGTYFFVLANGLKFSDLSFQSVADDSSPNGTIDVQLQYKAQPIAAAQFQGGAATEQPR